MQKPGAVTGAPDTKDTVMRAIAIVGPKKSGKTALLSLLAEALEGRGKRVAIIKYSTHPVERSNADAFWLMRPGRTVVALSPEESAVFWPRALSLKELAALLDEDVLLLEGGEGLAGMPRILCLGEDGDEDDLPESALTGGPVLALVGEDSGLDAPLRFAEATPETAEEIAPRILEKGLLLDG